MRWGGFLFGSNAPIPEYSQKETEGRFLGRIAGRLRAIAGRPQASLKMETGLCHPFRETAPRLVASASRPEDRATSSDTSN